MKENDQHLRSGSGPFGMGWQGYLIVAIVILGTALFAATRSNWQSMLVSALVLPLLMFSLIFALSHLWQNGAKVRNRSIGPREGMDLLTFLARTNPIMFLFLGALSRRSDDDRYQQLLRSGPYGMGQQGYLIAFLLLLTPLLITLIIMAFTGQQPTHIGPHLP